MVIRLNDALDQLPNGLRKPQRDTSQLAADGLSILRRRGVVTGEERLQVPERERAVLAYYANTIRHHFGEKSG